MEQVGSTFQFEPYGEPALNRILRQRGSRNGFAYFDEGARELFRWAGGPNGLLTWNPDAAQDVRAAAERIGLIPLLTEFYPSSLSDLIAERHGTVEPDHTSGTWQRWFSKVTEGAFLIPDTGVILRRVLTTIILPRFSDPRLRLPFRLAIPRLVILELENLANRSGDKTQVKKGECFMAFHEIARLKKTGAMLAAPLGLDDLSSFRSSSGSGMADAFLREEVRKFAKRIISLPEASTRPRTIFHTRDMVSALAANAEDLDAIYMAPATPEKLQIEGLNLSQVATLVTELAVSRGMGSIRWHDGAATKIEGIWSGKTWLEYDQKQVRLCDPKTNALP